MESSDLPSSKRQKTLAPSPASPSKGKEKMEEEPPSSTAGAAVSVDPAAEEATCGICLLGGGRSIRGGIDSCDHFFCFICIMEWAKVETRCPMCKQRFRSIRRPAVRGIFRCERIVDVPVRDQVYHPLGNESETASDPYANTICSECHTATDEELLLLCDLCDSASHTYCAGLGATVPEGDWYCHDCTMIRDEHSRAHSDSDSGIPDSYSSLRAVRASEAPVSISEIVSGEILSDFSQGSSTRQVVKQQQNVELSSPRRNSTNQGESQGPVALARETVPSVQAKGRTLRHCRDVQDHIRILRSNWNGIRSGSLNFSSSLLSGRKRDHDKYGKGSRDSTSALPDPMSSGSNGQTSDASASGKTHNSTDSGDVNKAWKMMKIARSMQGTRRGIMPNNTLSLAGKRNIISEEVGSRSHNHTPFVSKGHITKSEEYRIPSPTVFREKHKPPDLKKQKPVVETMKAIQHFHAGPPRTLSGCMELASSRQDRLLPPEDLCYGKKKLSTQQVLDDVCGRDPETSTVPRASDSSAAKPVVSSSCKVEPSNGKCRTGMEAGENLIRRNGSGCSEAKDEIQSLVKLNLKLLSRGQQLSASRFKEVAKEATHTILAACGLEHSKSKLDARFSTVPTCRHPEEIRKLRKSNLMPNSCRECFYSFVKDVVNSILSQRTLPLDLH